MSIANVLTCFETCVIHVPVPVHDFVDFCRCGDLENLMTDVEILKPW